MIKIKLYSQYSQFNNCVKSKYIRWTNEGKIEAYQDLFIPMAVDNKDNGKKKIALITEPRTIWNSAYKYDLGQYLQEHYDIFEYIFTFDPILLQLPNAKPMPFVGVWSTNDVKKDKNISMCCSNKAECEGHIKRQKIANQLKNKVDVLGNYFGKKRVSTKDIYSKYKYSIVLENEKDEWYFTEKVLNAFANKCVPIYYGSPKILELFNPAGIIYVDNIEDIPKVLDILHPDDYISRIEAIKDNYNRVKKYQCYEDYLYLTYKDELEGLWKY